MPSWPRSWADRLVVVVGVLVGAGAFAWHAADGRPGDGLGYLVVLSLVGPWVLAKQAWQQRAADAGARWRAQHPQAADRAERAFIVGGLAVAAVFLALAVAAAG